MKKKNPGQPDILATVPMQSRGIFHTASPTNSKHGVSETVCTETSPDQLSQQQGHWEIAVIIKARQKNVSDIFQGQGIFSQIQCGKKNFFFLISCTHCTENSKRPTKSNLFWLYATSESLSAECNEVVFAVSFAHSNFLKERIA